MSNDTIHAAPASSPDDAAGPRQQMELDRRIFHIRTLYEAARELSNQPTPAALLSTFLPLAMGPLGLTFGFGVMMRSGKPDIASRGLDATAREHLERTGTELIGKFFSAHGNGPAIATPAVLVGQHLSQSADIPVGTNAIAVVPIDDVSHMVLGFGPKLTGEPFADDETDLLNGLVTNLSTTLKKTCSDERVHTLNLDLKDKNARTKQALREAQLARKALDRRAFQLHTLYEATLELSAINDPKVLCNAFLLTLMGTFSFASGWIGLYGPGDTEPDVAYRGPEPDCLTYLASRSGRDKVLGRFVELKDRMPHCSQSCLLEGEASVSALPLDTKVGMLFALDNEWRGAIGLALPLSDEPLSDEMRQLLLSLIGTFVVTLGNAKHTQLIHALNSDLAARNVELQNTLDALTSAKQEINLLTEAKDAVIRLVRGEVDRVWRASWLDVSLIILAGIVLGTLFNLSSPSGIDLLPKSLLEPPSAVVEIAQANQFIQDGAVIIDARPAEFYLQGHIKDAVNLPKDMFSFVYSMKLSSLDPAVPLIVYGRNISRHYDADVARELELLGHEKVMVLEEGMSAWEEAGYEVTQ